MRVAVVTGASSGIGAELVRRLRSLGWHTVGLSRRPSDADEHEDCDVSDRLAVDETAARVLARHQRVDLLVNNAGTRGGSGFLEIDPQRLEQTLATNFLGGVWVTRAFLPALARGSRIVNIVSVAGLIADGPYSATKHAQLALSRTLAVQLAPRGIHVLTVNPGYVETPGFPQRTRHGPLVRPLIVDPPFVVDRILAALDRGRREIVVPRWYRPFAVLQALAPGTLARARALARR